MPPSVKRRLSRSGASDDSDDSQQSHDATKDSTRQPGRKKLKRAVNGTHPEEDSNDYDLEIEGESSNGNGQVARSLPDPSAGKIMSTLESGTIARVELVNFMCHKYLKIDFGPKINFVIGHNGSGKSAILTALTIALGAKANSTNRGKNLASLIREGANAAMAVVHITNRGPDAYRPDIYGPVIQVERRLLRDGTGSYKIKSSSGKLISTKREELTAICDHMSIQVDNPITVLSQDNARQFLHTSSAHDKYKLFMRATQLTQLHDDYAKVRESMDITKSVIERKKQFLPELRKKAKEAEIRYKEMQEAHEIEAKIDQLNNELVWSQIIAKEKELAHAEQEVVECERHVQSANEKVVGSKNKLARFAEEIQEMKTHINEFKNMELPNSDEKRKLMQQKLEKENELRGIKTDTANVNEQVLRYRQRVKQYEREIIAETEKQDASAKRDDLLAKVAELEREKQDKLNRKKEMEEGLTAQDNKIREMTRRKEERVRSAEEIRSKIQPMQQKIKNLHEQKADKLKAFGQRMPEVIRDINTETRWSGRKPVGPLGHFLQLKQPEYANVLEVVLDRSMNAFLVETFQDRQMLLRILSRHRMERTPVIVAKYDLFDYSAGEPDEQYLTILRALDFEDEWVRRQLIISSSIEKCLLMDNLEEANRIMRQSPRNIKGCFTKGGHSVGAQHGLRTDTMKKYNGPPRFKKDLDVEIRDCQDQLRQLIQDERQIREEIKQMDRELTEQRQNYSKRRSSISAVESRIREINQRLNRLQEELQEAEPVNIQAIKTEKEEMENKIRMLVGQFSALKQRDNEIRAAHREIIEQLQRIESEEETRSARIAEMMTELQNIEMLRQREAQTLKTFEDRLAQRKRRKEALMDTVTALKKTVKEWTNQAMAEYPDRVETTETTEELKRKIDLLEIRRIEKENTVGASLEEVLREAEQALNSWNEARNTIDQMEQVLKILKRALDSRTKHWEGFRMYMSLSAMAHFTYYMHKRGDNGHLKFNHIKEKLEVRVSTGDQFRKGTRHKDSKSLSGGEKSFSQVSLLLALWQGVSSPLLCLDEFDVYMDAVNRKQSMKMMMDSASENSSQYILITPQDASNMTPGPYITVHRLADPERGGEV